MNVVTPLKKLTPADFATDQEVRWCPGCGDYAILKAMQRTLVDIGATKENTVFISGIGCAARFPYYMATYGFHTIHGRAPSVGTGIKLANPDLDVWVITGDGDALSIGGNHLLHVLRRNVNLQVLLFNNEIYGLTKGQYSPTSRAGTRSPSTPLGSIENPVSAAALALGAGARFVARSVDTMQKHLPVIFKRAHDHNGTSFVEIFQNCIVYNPTAWTQTTEPDVRDDNILFLEEGEPLVFGRDRDKGIRVNSTGEPEVVQLGENGVNEDDLLIHREGLENTSYVYMLSRMSLPDFPVPFGVLRAVDKPSYTELLMDQVEQSIQSLGRGNLTDLYHASGTWEVR